MKAPQEAMIAYLSTVTAIVLLAGIGALVLVFMPDEWLERALTAQRYIEVAIVGLIGILGTFRPQGKRSQDEPHDEGEG